MQSVRCKLSSSIRESMAGNRRTMKKVANFSFLVLLLHLLHGCSSSHTTALSPDGEALLSLKSKLLDPLGLLSDWMPSSHAAPCSWSGVRCDPSAMVVVALDLTGKNLSGTISDDIQRLAYLTSLNISRNQFSGTLPPSLTLLAALQFLDISHNLFNESLPKGLMKLRSLVNFTAYSNNFTGPLSLEFVDLPSLEHLDLGGSYFEGPIPSAYGAFGSLEYLDLSGNSLNGNIPSELGNLTEIKLLKIGWNSYVGGIPSELGNLSTLELLDLAGASLTGSIPSSLGRLHRLNTLFLYRNQLTGKIPDELGNLSSLMSLDLSQNELTGSIPESFGKLRSLRLFSLMYNRFGGEIPSVLADLPNLMTFLVWNNSFNGSLPEHLGRFSPLSWLDVSANSLSGPIPPDLCAGGKLFKLLLFSNQFSGSIPDSLTRCQPLWRLRIEDNNLTGPIPHGFDSLQNFTYLDASFNSLSGGIPADLLAAPALQFVDVSYNPLGGSIPSGLWITESLQKINASSCNLSGEITGISQCPPLITLDLSGNSLRGSIPSELARCKKLNLLALEDNQFSGAIPPQLAKLPVLSTLDLSHNELSGTIPPDFQDSTTLETLDVSYNNLTGPVPSDGLFKFISPSLLAGNKGLCGGVLAPCSNAGDFTASNSVKRKGTGSTAWVVGAIFALTVIILVVGTRCFYKKHKWYICSKVRQEREEGPWILTAFQRLSFTAEDIVQCLNTDNVIGMGAAGTVFKAEMPSGEVVAVKKLWRSQKELHYKGQLIVGEVDVLGSVRHRNIVKLLGYCSNNEGTLLLYEYMPNGSLGDLLHSNKEANILADWMTRYKIAIGVAQGLCYLHHDCFPVVIHRDVKSNNILLDMNLEARVADFGLAKLIEATESMSAVAGSYGYIAPEYAYTMQVDEKSDIYSFGVVLMELLTGKRPIEPEFGESTNIVEWVRQKIRANEGLTEVLDASIGASLSWVREEMTLVLRVALLCTSKTPADRPSMRDVVTMLMEAKPRRKSDTEAITTVSRLPLSSDAEETRLCV